MRDLKTPSGSIVYINNWVWLVLIITYTGVSVACLTIHGGFWITRTLVYMDTIMFVLQFIMYNLVNAYHNSVVQDIQEDIAD
jgi:hypothetical protein